MLNRCFAYFIVVFTVGILILPLSAKAAGDEDLRLMEEDIAELSDRLDKVETKSILDRVVIGGEFRTRMDYFRYEDTTASGIEDDANTKDIWTNRFRLNLKADITEDLVFYGRLSYFKLWGESMFDGLATDINRGNIPDSEGNLRVERAYIEYFMPDANLSLTIGRLPMSEGPPSELRENRTRKGTYPNVIIDGELDGISLNIHLSEFTDLENAFLRIIYPKLGQNWLGYRGIEMDEVIAPTIAFEMQIPDIENSLLWLNYTKLLGWPAFTMELPGMDLVSFPEDAAEVDAYVLHLQFNDINNDGLDWFLSFMYGDLDSNSEGTLYDSGYEIGVYGEDNPFDTLPSSLGESRSFSCFYTGLRYELQIEDLKNPKVGIEYNHGSKYWLAFNSTGSGNLIPKLGVRGDAYELYYIQPIDEKHMFLRVGCVYMDYEYENQMLLYGPMSESDMTVLNGYLLMDVLF